MEVAAWIDSPSTKLFKLQHDKWMTLQHIDRLRYVQTSAHDSQPDPPQFKQRMVTLVVSLAVPLAGVPLALLLAPHHGAFPGIPSHVNLVDVLLVQAQVPGGCKSPWPWTKVAWTGLGVVFAMFPQVGPSWERLAAGLAEIRRLLFRAMISTGGAGRHGMVGTGGVVGRAVGKAVGRAVGQGVEVC